MFTMTDLNSRSEIYHTRYNTHSTCFKWLLAHFDYSVSMSLSILFYYLCLQILKLSKISIWNHLKTEKCQLKAIITEIVSISWFICQERKFASSVWMTSEYSFDGPLTIKILANIWNNPVAVCCYSNKIIFVHQTATNLVCDRQTEVMSVI